MMCMQLLLREMAGALRRIWLHKYSAKIIYLYVLRQVLDLKNTPHCRMRPLRSIVPLFHVAEEEWLYTVIVVSVI